MPGGIGRFASRRNTSQSNQEAENQKETIGNDCKEQKDHVSNDENSNIFASFGQRPMPSESTEFNFNMPFTGFDNDTDAEMQEAGLEDCGNFEVGGISFDEHHDPATSEVEMHTNFFHSQHDDRSAETKEIEADRTNTVINETGTRGESDNAKPKQGLNLFSRFKKKESQQQNALNHNNAQENDSTTLTNREDKIDSNDGHKGSLGLIQNPQLTDEHKLNSDSKTISPEKVLDQSKSISESTGGCYQNPKLDAIEPFEIVNAEDEEGTSIPVLDIVNAPGNSNMIEHSEQNHKRKEIGDNGQILEEEVTSQDQNRSNNVTDAAEASALMIRDDTIVSRTNTNESQEASTLQKVSFETNSDHNSSQVKIKALTVKNGNAGIAKETQISVEDHDPSNLLNDCLSHRKTDNFSSTVNQPSASLYDKDKNSKKEPLKTNVNSPSLSLSTDGCVSLQANSSQPPLPLLAKIVQVETGEDKDNEDEEFPGVVALTDSITSKSSLPSKGLEEAETDACLLSNDEQTINSSNNGGSGSILQQGSGLLSEKHLEDTAGISSTKANADSNGSVDAINEQSKREQKRKGRDFSHETTSHAIKRGGDSRTSSHSHLTVTFDSDLEGKNHNHTNNNCQQDFRKVFSPSASSHDNQHQSASPLRGFHLSQKRKVSWSPSTISRENPSLVTENNLLAQTQIGHKQNKIPFRSQVISTSRSQYTADEEPSKNIPATPAAKRIALSRGTPADCSNLTKPLSQHFGDLNSSNDTNALVEKQLVTPSPTQNEAHQRQQDMTPKRLISNYLVESKDMNSLVKGLHKDEERQKNFIEKGTSFQASSTELEGDVTRKGASPMNGVIEESFNLNANELLSSLSADKLTKQYEQDYDKMPFEDLLSKLQLDVTQSNDIFDKNENELVDLRVKLCVAENVSLRYQCSIDRILCDIETVLDEVSIDDCHKID